VHRHTDERHACMVPIHCTGIQLCTTFCASALPIHSMPLHLHLQVYQGRPRHSVGRWKAFQLIRMLKIGRIGIEEEYTYVYVFMCLPRMHTTFTRYQHHIPTPHTNTTCIFQTPTPPADTNTTCIFVCMWCLYLLKRGGSRRIRGVAPTNTGVAPTNTGVALTYSPSTWSFALPHEQAEEGGRDPECGSK